MIIYDLYFTSSPYEGAGHQVWEYLKKGVSQAPEFLFLWRSTWKVSNILERF